MSGILLNSMSERDKRSRKGSNGSEKQKLKYSCRVKVGKKVMAERARARRDWGKESSWGWGGKLDLK